jgi:hypothetical protein
LRAFRGMVKRSRYVEELGFDWVSVFEHHYSPRTTFGSARRSMIGFSRPSRLSAEALGDDVPVVRSASPLLQLLAESEQTKAGKQTDERDPSNPAVLASPQRRRRTNDS